MSESAKTPACEPFAAHSHGVTIAVRLTPKSSRDAIDGAAAGPDGRPHVKARVRALPAEGAANAALVKLFAKQIGVPRGAVSVLSGATSRSKTLLVRGDAAELTTRLRGLLMPVREE